MRLPKLSLLWCWLSVLLLHGNLSGQGLLKYVIYDFDGLDISHSDLPDGDFTNHDLGHTVTGNPLKASDVLGDRVLKIDLQWNDGSGEFGKAMMRFIELDPATDKLCFYFYNPTENYADADVEVIILEDDNGNDIFEGLQDDKWSKNLSIPRSSKWQLISFSLADMKDINPGGDGVFNAGFTGSGGMLFSVSFLFKRPSMESVSETYYMDMICLSEGMLPTGADILDLPAPKQKLAAKLGALGEDADVAGVPESIHAFLPEGNKLSFVNWFQFYAEQGTVANSFPGEEVAALLKKGYQPAITWEMMYNGYPRLHQYQPRLEQILNGSLDAYIDSFANKIKSYKGTVILRIFHEFEGDWYSWSLTENDQDPQKYITAYRRVVNIFRKAGANNVKWMWCLNSEPKPYRKYNWVVSCYPGDEYVDIIATDIYNHPDLGKPAWKSFRYTMAETYYYLTRYFPHKPLYVCEVGCRERYEGELKSSETKAEWICKMSRDLRTYFSRVTALIFFSTVKEHDWRINSSEEAKKAFADCIWNRAEFGNKTSQTVEKKQQGFMAWPNPFGEEIWFNNGGGGEYSLRIIDMYGKISYVEDGENIPAGLKLSVDLPSGLYLLEMETAGLTHRQKMVKLSRD